MSPVTITPVQNRISMAVGQGRGITAGEAIQRANDAIEALRIPCLNTIEEALNEIDLRFGASAPNRTREPLQDLYVLASQIIDLASFLPDTSLDQAANALCELVDQSLTARRTPWEAVDVTIGALKLLKSQGATYSPDRRAAIIKGLRDVIASRFPASPSSG